MISKYQLEYIARKTVSPLLWFRVPKELREYGFTWYDKPVSAHRKWNVDYALAWDTLASLAYFRKHNVNSYDPSFESWEDWQETIKKMENSFYMILKDMIQYGISVKDLEAYNEGMELYIKYFRSLWD